MRNAEKVLINTLAKGLIARDKEANDQVKQLAALHPAEPPPVLLEKTPIQKEIEEFYENNTVTSASGREAYAPPPVLLAPLTEEEKQ